MKVFHYFEHVRSSPSHDALVRFSADSVWDAGNPWLALRDSAVVGAEQDVPADVLFLAGADWRALAPAQRAGAEVPIVNLIQDFRMVRGEAPLREYLAHRAIRICVSPELEQAVREAGAPGPALTIPVGVDLDALPEPLAREHRDIDCVVLATKEPRLGAQVAERVKRRGHSVRVIDGAVPRAELLAAFARARVAVLLPAAVEGAYMPALEAMALRRGGGVPRLRGQPLVLPRRRHVPGAEAQRPRDLLRGALAALAKRAGARSDARARPRAERAPQPARRALVLPRAARSGGRAVARALSARARS